MRVAILILGMGLLFSACSRQTEAMRISSEIRRSMNPSGVVKSFLAALVQKDSYVLSHTTKDTTVYRDPIVKQKLLEVARKQHKAKWQEFFHPGGKATVMLMFQEQNGTMAGNSFSLSEVPKGQNSIYSWQIENFR